MSEEKNDLEFEALTTLTWIVVLKEDGHKLDLAEVHKAPGGTWGFGSMRGLGVCSPRHLRQIADFIDKQNELERGKKTYKVGDILYEDGNINNSQAVIIRYSLCTNEVIFVEPNRYFIWNSFEDKMILKVKDLDNITREELDSTGFSDWDTIDKEEK